MINTLYCNGPVIITHKYSPCPHHLLHARHQSSWLSSPGGSTLVLKSEGVVKEHQADVLGVYRMVDSYNERPVYKQDGGENYIYYR